VRWFNDLRGFAAGDGRAIVEQLPVITIAQGEMSAEPRGRHVIPLGDLTDGESERRIWDLTPAADMEATPDDVGVDYQALLRLAAVAMTPVIILRTWLWFGPWEPPGYFRWPIAILVTLFYLRMGIRAAAAAPAGEQPAQPVVPS